MKKITLHGIEIKREMHVWDWRYGWGTVIELDACPTRICVQFDITKCWFTEDGRNSPSESAPTLFWHELPASILQVARKESDTMRTTSLHGQKINVERKVWDLRYGWGTVTQVDKVRKSFLVGFDSTVVRYKGDGRSYDMHLLPTLFWDDQLAQLIASELEAAAR